MSHEESPGLASFQSYSYSTDDAPLGALQQLNDEQRARWEALQQQIEQADGVARVRALALAEGYALGLRDGRALDHGQHDELLAKLRPLSAGAGTAGWLEAAALKADSDTVQAAYAHWRELGQQLGDVRQSRPLDVESQRRLENQVKAAGQDYDVKARQFAKRMEAAIGIALGQTF